MMLATSWCGGMGVGGWLLMAGLWAGFLAVVVWAVGTESCAIPGVTVTFR
jgi:hypothetical protein